MKKTLILTGRSTQYLDYALAAAIALRHFKTADILNMSKDGLPGFLENVDGYSEIVVLGISLTYNQERLAKALAALKKSSVQVFWLSGIAFPASLGDEVRNGFARSYVSQSSSVSIAVAEYYNMDYSEWTAFSDGNSLLYKHYMELLKASEYYFRNYQDNQAVPQVVRHIAAHDTEDKWTEAERRMIKHYRRYDREFIGKSDVIMKLCEKINLLSRNDRARVLILGESGTGKETVAWQIHEKSRRGQADEPFIAFNCASVTPNLLESRFLGHEKGAFTGASEQRPGLFESANGGTLFLDEIGELPLEAQGILLRVLEEGRFQRLGGNAHEIEVNVRVIAATNRDLPAMVRDGKFRADLYYRLCTVQLRCPPLREHKEDIPDLAYDYRMNNNIGGKLTSAQIEALQSYDFPGNVRELNNLLEQAYVLGMDDYAELIREHKKLNSALLPQENAELPDNLEEATRLHVKRVCEKYCHNITKAAEALGLSRNTVRKYLE